MRRVAAGFLALGLAACGSSSLPVGPEELPPSPVGAISARTDRADPSFPFGRILCFGDSLTEGVTARYGQGLGTLTPVEGYVPKLAVLLTREFGEGIELINSGIGGEETAGGVARLSGETLIYRPDLVLLLEGVVDVNNERPRFGPTRANLREMVRIVKGREAAVIIGTVPPLNPEGFRARGAENVPRLNEIIRQIAAEEGIGLADHYQAFSGDLSLQGPDGLHPNDNGYRVMAETWFEAILASLEVEP